MQAFEAAKRGDFSDIDSWLKNGSITPEALNSLLREAAAHDAVDAVRIILNKGGDPYDTDEKGRTAFNRAASNGLHALHIMTEAAFLDTQKPAAQRRWKNFDLNTPSGYYGSTLITYAAKVSSAALVNDMIESGADITITNGSGWTLLHCAAVMPDRKDVLISLVKAFRDQGLEKMIGALSTHVYETDYSGNKVVYGENLTAAGLCRARLDQDPQCPPELAGYLLVLK